MVLLFTLVSPMSSSSIDLSDRDSSLSGRTVAPLLLFFYPPVLPPKVFHGDYTTDPQG
ncbi:hypothetical protein NQZ68_020599 [Dissostichus eleginoides]|nr:hypothetical protein NQZ68_020599 [Dissostichus eleginoides]